ncbi:hypothetical protein M770_31525 (plasmid) [Pseudomonas aeruginosa VRFPA03]|nr:hypothetical protein M770_31525 [Pseudomonas aeruginosa VRFPA03]
MNKLLKPFSVLVMLACLAGCATNPMTGEREINRTAVGAVVGTVAGGLIGAAIGDSRAASLVRQLVLVSAVAPGSSSTVSMAN